MIKIKIQNKDYKIPNSFNELSINQFQMISEIEELKDKLKFIKFLNVLSGIDEKTIGMLDIVDVKQITNELNYFEINKEDHDLIEAVEIDKVIYKFDKDLFNMRFDMFIDLEEFTKEKEDIINNLHLIMAILYRPIEKHRRFDKFFNKKLIIKEYNSDDVKERAELFKEKLMMDKVIGALFFFIKLKTKYITDMTDYLTEETNKLKKEMI